MLPSTSPAISPAISSATPPPFCPHFCVALTGGIASGKTAVSQYWAALGVRIVDTDVIAHALTAPGGAALPAITAQFGAALLTPEGAMDRSAMRERVFSDAQARKQLEAILHPMIHREAQMQGGAPLSCREAYVAFVVPLLVGVDGQAGLWRQRVQRIAVVDCAPELQTVRLMARTKLSFATAQTMLAAQASRAQRLHFANDVLGNDGDLTQLHRQAAQLHEKYTVLARGFAANAPQAQGEALN